MNCLFIYLPPFFSLFSFWWQRGTCVCIYSSMIPGLKAVCVFAECDTSFVIPNLNPCIFSPSQTSYHQMLRFSALFMLETNINTSWYQLQTVSNWSAITLKKHCKKNTCRSPNTHTHTHTQSTCITKMASRSKSILLNQKLPNCTEERNGIQSKIPAAKPIKDLMQSDSLNHNDSLIGFSPSFFLFSFFYFCFFFILWGWLVDLFNPGFSWLHVLMGWWW